MFGLRHHGCEGRRHARDGFGFGRGMFHGGHHHGRHGGRREGRLFDHGDLRLVILELIAEAPRHGYEIMKIIEEKLGGAYSPSPGVVYPTLTLLEELGLIALDTSESSKKLYAITPEGKAHLEANAALLQAIQQRIAEAGSAYGGGAALPILRAMKNLRLALRLRLSQGPLSEAQIRAVTEVLDAAAQSVERS